MAERVWGVCGCGQTSLDRSARFLDQKIRSNALFFSTAKLATANNNQQKSEGREETQDKQTTKCLDQTSINSTNRSRDFEMGGR
jgi:hypothetical protein